MKKRVLETKYDIFPLDKMLPLATVYRFFKDEYDKKSDNNHFFSDRKYQKLREGYFSLFVAITLGKISGKEYFMHFPQCQDNDVNFLSFKASIGSKPVFWKVVCDVKEFTEHSQSFYNFVDQTIAPKIHAHAYHLIIGAHVDIAGKTLESLAKLCTPESIVWIVSSPSPENFNYNAGIVTTIQGKNKIRRDEIDLGRDIPINDDLPIVYQDVLRDQFIVN